MATTYHANKRTKWTDSGIAYHENGRTAFASGIAYHEMVELHMHQVSDIMTMAEQLLSQE